MNILYIVIPCYNEEAVLEETNKKLLDKLTKLLKNKMISDKSRILFVNDGSKDKTWDLIEEYNKYYKYTTGICLSRNEGHQNALVAGLLVAKEYADIIISMDADLQDDVNAIDEMLEKYYEGNDIVYGVRNNRKKDSFFKKTTALSFYKFMEKMGVDIIYNHADYRLTSKRVLNNFEDFKEVNLFLRGIFPLIGYKSDVVYYNRTERFAGESKYPWNKMLNFALDGITSFSVKPIRFILNLGILMIILSMVMIIYSVIMKIIGNTVDGWTFITCSIWLIAGVQMLSLGVIGEYIGKIYSETKSRPRYIISKNLCENKNEDVD